MEKLKLFLETNENAKILDVGTGRGGFISIIDYLYKGYEKIIGIDIYEPAVKAASKYFEENEKIDIVKADINENDYKDSEFDIVCLSNSLHHLEDVSKTFRSMERLVKPGGYIIYNEMMNDNLDKKQISHKLIHHFSAKLDRESGMYHRDTYGRDEIVNLIRKESTFVVQDFWDMESEQEETTPEQVEQFAKTVDMLLGRAKPELQEKYKEEGNKIKEYILKNGVEGCTQMIVISKNTQ